MTITQFFIFSKTRFQNKADDIFLQKSCKILRFYLFMNKIFVQSCFSQQQKRFIKPLISLNVKLWIGLHQRDKRQIIRLMHSKNHRTMDFDDYNICSICKPFLHFFFKIDTLENLCVKTKCRFDIDFCSRHICLRAFPRNWSTKNPYTIKLPR